MGSSSVPCIFLIFSSDEEERLAAAAVSHDFIIRQSLQNPASDSQLTNSIMPQKHSANEKQSDGNSIQGTRTETKLNDSISDFQNVKKKKKKK